MATPRIRRIRRLLNEGLDKSEIVARLSGTDDNSGGAATLSRAELEAIGFGDSFINRVKGTSGSTTSSGYTVNWQDSRFLGGSGITVDYPDGRRYDSSTGSFSGGSGGSGGGQTPTTPTSPGGGIPMPPVEPGRDKESAFTAFRNFMLSLGIPMGADIEGIIRRAVEDGYGPQDMYLVLPEIQDTTTWRNRFPGWHARVQAGYNQLTVGEYLSLENSYHRILQEAGLPAGFYDSPSDFGQWIASNVSPQEVQERVDIAVDMVRKVDPTARDLLSKFYGVTSGDLASYFLDQKRALPALERQYKAVNVAQWAVRNGLKVAGPQRYEDMVDAGITSEMAMQGFAVVRNFNDTLGKLGDIYGIGYDQTDAEDDVFFGRDEKRRRIVANERATFSGSSRGDVGRADRGTSY